jgi:hypothetical protein
MDATAPTKTKVVPFDTIIVADRFLYNLAAGETSFFLAVDPTATETRFVFKYPERSDTLVLSYSTQTIVLSPDCGSYNFIGGLEVKYSTFDTDRVIIKNHRLLTSVESNVEILF